MSRQYIVFFSFEYLNQYMFIFNFISNRIPLDYIKHNLSSNCLVFIRPLETLNGLCLHYVVQPLS